MFIIQISALLSSMRMIMFHLFADFSGEVVEPAKVMKSLLLLNEWPESGPDGNEPLKATMIGKTWKKNLIFKAKANALLTKISQEIKSHH